MDVKTINVGMIGFGIAGKVFHAPFIENTEGMHLAKISTANRESAAYAHSHYPEAEVVRDAHEIIDDPAIDLVIVGTPNTAHFPLTKECLMAGKHVIVEKPFTINTGEADVLIDLARKKNLVLTIHHNRRFDSDFRTIQKVISSGLLGRLVEYEVHYDRYRPMLKANAWREENLPGSGILYDLGSHLIDQVLVLFGKPDEVRADIRIQREGAKAIDNFDVILYYPGLKVILKAGMLVRDPGPHFLLCGDLGTFTKYGMDVQENALKAGQVPKGSADWGKEPEEMWGKIKTEHKGLQFSGIVESEAGNYTDYFINVRDAIWGTAELIVKAEQARDTIQIIELAMQSSREKRAVQL